jgi:hypothetical protein
MHDPADPVLGVENLARQPLFGGGTSCEGAVVSVSLDKRTEKMRESADVRE